MRLVKPTWLTHAGEKSDTAIYSIHVSPDGKRVATGGGDSYVRLWAADAIYQTGNSKYDGPKQLASMSYHDGTVHAVRFSPGGKLIASGADDRGVCIYNHLDEPPPNTTFGTSETPPVENWRLFRRLVAHENDVQDLGWSHDGSILVSVGLDSKIVVWSGYTFENLKTISAHTSHVKGITFDPANKYFATASDDRTIKIFRFTSPTQNYTRTDAVNNFMLETSISQPFVSSPLTTYFRRCSWGPDGDHIAAANAVNGPVSAIAIIERSTWGGDTTLIGHEAAIEVCAFSPRLYASTANDALDVNGQPTRSITVIACGGGDRSLSIWTTSSPRPLFVGVDVASKSISDIAWTPDGQALFVSSLDGSVVTFGFEEGELGYAKPIEENDRSLQKYGTARKGGGFPETTDALLLEEMSKKKEQKDVEGRMGALMGETQSQTPHIINGINKHVDEPGSKPNGVAANEEMASKVDHDAVQLERLKNRVEITKDGKKRIKPLLISSVGGSGEASLPQGRLQAAVGSNNVQNESFELLDLSKPYDGLPKGGLASLLLGSKRKFAEKSKDDAEDEDIVSPAQQIEDASKNERVPILEHTSVGTVQLATAQTAKTGQEPTPTWVRPAVLNPSIATSQLRLSVPKIRSSVHIGYDSKAHQPSDISSPALRERCPYVFEARNPPSSSLTGRPQDREPCRVSLMKNNTIQWTDYLRGNVLLVTGNESFWCAADESGSLFLWTPAGRRMNSPIVIEAQPVILASHDSWLLCLSAVGMCYVWNIKTMSSPHPPVSVAPTLDQAIYLAAHPTAAPAVTNARLNSEGRIIITLSNGEGYVYVPQMYCWQRVSEVWWAVGSQYWNSIDSNINDLRSSNGKNGVQVRINPAAGVIPWMERRTTLETLLAGRAHFLKRLVRVLVTREGYEGFESSVSIAHLENRIAAALVLGAKDEFRLYLMMYVKRMGVEGLKGKAEELLQTLVGGIEDGDEPASDSVAAKKNTIVGRNWMNIEGDTTDMICGWVKKELLAEVIILLGKHRDMQRITVPYARILRVLGEDPDGDVAGQDAMLT